MLNIERLEYILKELKTKRVVYVNQLSEQYYVSKSTIRRDLSELEREGLIRRSYGGAVLVEQKSTEIPFFIRKNEIQAAKDIIGLLAAQLVKDDMYIFLDSTSTVAHMTKYLKEKKNIRILTTSAQTALDCLDTLEAQICCTGGWMHSYSRGFIGEFARQRISDFNTDILFFSSRSVSLKDGITDVNEEEISLKQQMLKKCRKSAFLCDKTKLDETSFRSVCEIDRIDYMITDEEPDKVWIEKLKELGVKLIYPNP